MREMPSSFSVRALRVATHRNLHRKITCFSGKAWAVFAQPATAALIQGEEIPGPSVATREDTIAYSLATGTGLYHAVGSAAMGPNDTDVVDHQLRVRGVAGLRIADASVLPFQLSGNTAAPRHSSATAPPT